MVLNDRIEIADRDYNCSACDWLASYLDNNRVDTGLKFGEWRAWKKAAQNNYQIKAGEPMRVYEWVDAEYDPEPYEIRSEHVDMTTIRELPEIAAICIRLQLYEQ